MKKTSSTMPVRGDTPNRRKSRKITVTLAIGIVLFLAAAAGILLFRGSQNSQVQCEAEQYVEEFLEKYNGKDESAGDYLMLSLAGPSEMTYQGLQGLLAENLTWEITGSEETDADTCRCVVYLKVQNVDMEAILREIEQAQDMSVAENLAAELEARITEPDCPRAEYACSVEVTSYRSGLKIIVSESLSNALYGGLNTYVAGLLKGGA